MDIELSLDLSELSSGFASMMFQDAISQKGR
jgi:hypothetical protein